MRVDCLLCQWALLGTTVLNPVENSAPKLTEQNLGNPRFSTRNRSWTVPYRLLSILVLPDIVSDGFRARWGPFWFFVPFSIREISIPYTTPCIRDSSDFLCKNLKIRENPGF